MKSLDENDKTEIHVLAAEAGALQDELNSLMRRMVEARKIDISQKTKESRRALEQLAQEGAAASERMQAVVERMATVMDLSKDEIEMLNASDKVADSPPRYRRDLLTVEHVPSDGLVDELLAKSYDNLLELIPATTLDKYRSMEGGAPWRMETGGLLSIVKGVVVESEFPRIHRFAQGIGESRALLTNDPGYDIYAGASLIPQIARLAERLDVLADIPGAMKRVHSLWRGPSTEVDSTIFELLVAAGCAVKGRSVEFIDRQKGKTADLRCWDPIPLVVECKRKRVLTEYELTEERVMRQLFNSLEAGARKAGKWGVFSLHLSVEVKAAAIEEIVSSMLKIRSSSEAISELWGTATYTESGRVVGIEPTRMYSPIMLSALFNWNTDLAEWDGLVCRVVNHAESVVDMASEPVGLRWVNTSEQAIKKRSWGPMTTLREAVEQIPPGEFGVPYIAYQEGARSEIADMRTFNFSDWLKGCDHSSDVRVPFGQIIRMYPRPLGHGAPDFIESSMPFIPEYGDELLSEFFPSNVIVS